VFKEVAERGFTSAGWFYGFKLHLIMTQEKYWPFISPKAM